MKPTRKLRTRKALSLALVLALSVMAGGITAAPAPDLGSAGDFTILSAAPGSGGAVTCTTSTVVGDIASSGLPAAVVQTGCLLGGAIVAPVAPQVLTDFSVAYDAYAAIPCTGTLETAYTGATLTLTPGVYCNAAAVTFTDTNLILDGLGDPNAVWIFKIGTGGTGALTGTNLSMALTGGAQSCNVSWWVAQAATMTTSGFQGTILAGAAATVTGLAVLPPPLGVPGVVTGGFNGNILAKAGITLTDVSVNGCSDPGPGPGPGDDDDDDDNGPGPKCHKRSHHGHGHHGRDCVHNDRHDQRGHHNHSRCKHGR